MKMRMLLTPESNIKKGRVVTKCFSFTQTYDWTDKINVYDQNQEKEKRIIVFNISIHEHLIIIDDIHHHIIHAFSFNPKEKHNDHRKYW